MSRSFTTITRMFSTARSRFKEPAIKFPPYPDAPDRHILPKDPTAPDWHILPKNPHSPPRTVFPRAPRQPEKKELPPAQKSTLDLLLRM